MTSENTSLLGRKARIFGDRPATITDHYTQGFLGDDMKVVTVRFDLPQDAASCGATEFHLRIDQVDFSDGPVTLFGSTVGVTVPMRDWTAAVKSARCGKDEASPEIAARGHILGRAAKIIAHREAARRPMTLPTDEQIEDAAVHVHSLLVFGDDPQSLDRMRRGFGPAGCAVAYAPSQGLHFADTLADVRETMTAQAANDRARSASLGENPAGWAVWARQSEAAE